MLLPAQNENISIGVTSTANCFSNDGSNRARHYHSTHYHHPGNNNSSTYKYNTYNCNDDNYYYNDDDDDNTGTNHCHDPIYKSDHNNASSRYCAPSWF